MTKPKRKSPEKKKPAAPRATGLLLKGAGALGRLVARHPRSVGGFAAFAVAFGFIAANALWYQPGGHPSPFLKTRSADNSLGFTATRPEPHDVTTFVIEREITGAGGLSDSALAEIATFEARHPARPGD